MKTLLLAPLINIPKSTPPLGLCYLQASLDKAGHETKLVDIYDTYDQIEKIIEDYNPDVVGVSCFTTNRSSSYKIAEIAKKVKPEAKIILGGPHATFFWKQIMDNFSFVDFVVIGEGEITIVDLLSALEKEMPLENVKGIIFRNEKGEAVKTEPRPLIDNLDDIPFPSYKDIDLEKYAIPVPPTVTKKEVKANLITSRGCPFGCAFCSTTQFWSRRWRARSAKNVVDEIEWLYREHGVKFFSFSDDIFTVDKQRTIDICKEIIERDLKIKWFTETRVDCVSKEMFEWMKRAGCYMIEFGVESGSPKILKIMNKMFTREQAIEAVKMAKEAELKTEVMLIIGSPGESRETIKETKDFLDECKPDIVIISILYIFPQTKIYQMAKEAGVIDDDFWLTETPTKPYTAEHPLKELYRMRLSVIIHYQLGRGWISLLKYFLGQIRKTPNVVLDHLKNLI